MRKLKESHRGGSRQFLLWCMKLLCTLSKEPPPWLAATKTISYFYHHNRAFNSISKINIIIIIVRFVRILFTLKIMVERGPLPTTSCYLLIKQVCFYFYFPTFDHISHGSPFDCNPVKYTICDTPLCSVMFFSSISFYQYTT